MSKDGRQDQGSARAALATDSALPGKSSSSARLSRRQIVFRIESPDAAGPRDDNGVAAGADAAVASASSSSGAPLPDAVRGPFESSLGADLSAVRVHTGAPSVDAAGAVGALAYTTGNDIHFGAGQYAPADPFGLHLLAHEVAHTVQQAGAAPQTQHKLEVGAPGDAAEVEADRAADAMVSGASARISSGAAGAQRVAAADVPAAPKAGALVNASWMSVVPDAVVATGDKAQTASSGANSAAGALTNYQNGALSYHQAGTGAAAHEIATTGALPGTTTQADVDKAVAAVAAARTAIHARYLHDTGHGYQSTTVDEASQKSIAPNQEGVQAAKDYRTWLKTATPTIVKSPTDPQWLIYQTLMPWEGGPSAMNSYDSVNVTWGSGFSGAGQVMELILRVFDKSPEIRAAFFNAGVTIGADGGFCVVDVDRKWKLHGQDAQLYVRSHAELQALMINCAQGVFQAEFTSKAATSPDPRQAVLDANFETFMNNAASGMPASIAGWATLEAALATHARHALQIYRWSDFESLSPHAPADVAQRIWDRAFDWKTTQHNGSPSGFANTWLEVIVADPSFKAAVVKRPDPPPPTPVTPTTPTKVAPKLMRSAATTIQRDTGTAPAPTTTAATYSKAKRAQMQWPDGIMMTFYAKFDPPVIPPDADAAAAKKIKDKYDNDKYFEAAATIDAAQLLAIKASGKLVQLGVATPIQTWQTIVDTVATTTAALKQIYDDEALTKDGASVDKIASPDAWKVKYLNIYSHGDIHFLGTGGSTNNNVNSTNPAQLAGFIKGLAPNLKSDVNVALMACATGSNAPKDPTEDAKTKGAGTFADSLHGGLVDAGLGDSSVLGHTTYGPATENSNLRVFAGAKGAGSDLFGRIFPDVATLFATHALKAGIKTADDFGNHLIAWFAGYMRYWQVVKEISDPKSQAVKIGLALSLAPDVTIPVVQQAFAAATKWDDFAFAPRIDLYQLGRVNHVVAAILKAQKESGAAQTSDFDAAITAVSACNMADLLNLLEDLRRMGLLGDLRKHVGATYHARILVAMDAVEGKTPTIPANLETTGEGDTIRNYIKAKGAATPGTAPLADWK